MISVYKSRKYVQQHNHNEYLDNVLGELDRAKIFFQMFKEEDDAVGKINAELDVIPIKNGGGDNSSRGRIVGRDIAKLILSGEKLG